MIEVEVNSESFFFKSETVKQEIEESSFKSSSADVIVLFLLFDLLCPIEVLISEIAGVVFIELVINICSIDFILSLNCVIQLVNILTSFLSNASSELITVIGDIG